MSNKTGKHDSGKTSGDPSSGTGGKHSRKEDRPDGWSAGKRLQERHHPDGWWPSR